MIKKLLSWKWWWAVGVVLAVGTIGTLANRSCDYSKDRIILEEHVRNLEVEVKGLEKVRAHQDVIIAAKDVELERIRAEAGKPSAEEKAKDKTIAEQKQQIAALKAQGDYKAALEVSEAENRAWEAKFTLAETRHAEAFAALDKSWQAKFDAQVVIAESWKRQWEGEHAIRIETGKVLLKAESALRWERLKFKGAGLIAVAAGGFLLYEQLKGSSK